MTNLVSLGKRRPPQRQPDAVELVFDLGSWSAALTCEGKLLRRKGFFRDAEQARALCQQISAELNIPFYEAAHEQP